MNRREEREREGGGREKGGEKSERGPSITHNV